MATVKMGQLHCGDCYPRKWNAAWKVACAAVFGGLTAETSDDLPQDVSDELFATAFWLVVDGSYNGKVPKQLEWVEVPPRPTRSLGELLRACS